MTDTIRSEDPEAMISYVVGDLFESPAQTLVNTVNTVGVMGKGIALTFKRIYPEMFKEYRGLCERRELEIGALHLYRTPHKNVLNFPTKVNWRNPSKPEYIEAGLRTFVRNYEKMRIRSVAFPPLGCGNGELDFAGVVKPIMDHYLRSLPIPVYIYAPLPRNVEPEHRTQQQIKRWLRSYPADLPFDEVMADLREAFRVPRRLRTLSGRGKYEAVYEDDGDRSGVRVMTSSKSDFVPEEELVEVWHQLRELGFITLRGVPGDRERVASYIFPLFAALPYVQVAELGDTYESLKFNRSYGLQLAPAGATGRDVQREMQLA